MNKIKRHLLLRGVDLFIQYVPRPTVERFFPGYDFVSFLNNIKSASYFAASDI